MLRGSGSVCGWYGLFFAPEPHPEAPSPPKSMPPESMLSDDDISSSDDDISSSDDDISGSGSGASPFPTASPPLTETFLGTPSQILSSPPGTDTTADTRRRLEAVERAIVLKYGSPTLVEAQRAYETGDTHALFRSGLECQTTPPILGVYKGGCKRDGTVVQTQLTPGNLNERLVSLTKEIYRLEAGADNETAQERVLDQIMAGIDEATFLGYSE